MELLGTMLLHLQAHLNWFLLPDFTILNYNLLPSSVPIASNSKAPEWFSKESNPSSSSTSFTPRNFYD
ncbi:hypothetical protein CDAR_251761 [Caerostris darwini]|uniref:Uncharacterized protein n=1 Tax=Caerostris darwini TaxID=1538125 RepID=A0AAV4V538_9ARAC|nr:hypothetical protein CDAR_251761 [Caerostris darwini]